MVTLTAISCGVHSSRSEAALNPERVVARWKRRVPYEAPALRLYPLVFSSPSSMIPVRTRPGASMSMAANSNSMTFCEWVRSSRAGLPRSAGTLDLIVVDRDPRSGSVAAAFGSASMLSGLTMFSPEVAGKDNPPVHPGSSISLRLPHNPSERIEIEEGTGGRIEDAKAESMVPNPQPPLRIGSERNGGKRLWRTQGSANLRKLPLAESHRLITLPAPTQIRPDGSW